MMEMTVEPMGKWMTSLLQEVKHLIDFLPFLLTVKGQGGIFLQP